MNDEKNPYAYGYARMPRIIRKGYKHLTNMQKLLYIYLRDLCGEDGTCYRSLRSLKDETGFSIGYLSVAIPVLHNEGLIHAEMRKTRSTHWEVWHISVIDIWDKNAQFIQAEKAKCSPDEQMEEQSVQDMNRSVHQMNRIDESVHEVNESVHAMILNKNPIENPITENQDREESAAENVSDFTDWKRKTNPQLPVVTSDIASQYHIANTTGYEKDDEPTDKRPVVTKGQAHNHDSMGSNSLHDLPGLRVPDLGNAGIDRQVRRSAQEEIATQQTPAASVSLSLAAIPRGGQDDTGGRQAHRSPVSLSTLTPAASCGLSATGTPPARTEARQADLKIVRAGVTQEKLSLKEDAPMIRQETAAQILKRQERRRDEILALYGQELGRKPSRSKENLAGAMLCAQDDVPDEDIRTTIKAILADDFLSKNMSMAFVYKKLDALAKKSPPLQKSPERGKDEPELGVSGLPKWKGRDMRYA